MEITFRTRRLSRTFSSERQIRREYGDAMANVIMARLRILLRAPNLSQVLTTPPLRRHQLSGERAGQFAIDLTPNYRLIFVPNHLPVPLKEDGGIDTDRVTDIEIVEVVDYH